jgi:hypothetical protein
MSKYFESLSLHGKTRAPNSDMQKAILYCFEAEDGTGVIIRHRPELPPQLIIEIGERLVELGKRLQQ